MVDFEQNSADSRQPAVLIHCVAPSDRRWLDPILWGLEEEGIPFQLKEVADNPAASIGKRAADASPLSVGIGIDGGARIVCLHHRDLKEDQPLFSLDRTELDLASLRRLGINAARLVKGNPLVFDDGEPKEEVIESKPDSAGINPDSLVEVIARIVTEIIQKQ